VLEDDKTAAIKQRRMQIFFIVWAANLTSSMTNLIGNLFYSSPS